MARVLVVDDDSAVREVTAHMLRQGGYEVLAHAGGFALLEILREEAFDLVLTDLNMPSLDGWAVGHWVRRNRGGVPVIAVSGLPAARADGGNPFEMMLMKPVRRAKLLAAITDVLQARADPNLRSPKPGVPA